MRGTRRPFLLLAVAGLLATGCASGAARQSNEGIDGIDDREAGRSTNAPPVDERDERDDRGAVTEFEAAFPADYVLATREAKPNPFAPLPEYLRDRDFEIRRWSVEQLPPVWQDGRDPRSGPQRTDEPDPPSPTELTSRERQLAKLVRAYTGDGPWDRGGPYLAIDDDGLAVRQSGELLQRVERLFEAVGAADDGYLVATTVQMVAVQPGAMSAFRTLFPLPGASGTGLAHAVLDAQDVDHFLHELAGLDAGTPASAATLSARAGQAAVWGTTTRRSRVLGYRRDEAGHAHPATTDDPRGFVLGLRSVPLDGGRRFVLALQMELATSQPYLVYPLDGGQLRAQASQGMWTGFRAAATVDAGATLLLLLPDTVQHEGEPRLVLVLLTPREVRQQGE